MACEAGKVENLKVGGCVPEHPKPFEAAEVKGKHWLGGIPPRAIGWKMFSPPVSDGGAIINDLQLQLADPLLPSSVADGIRGRICSLQTDLNDVEAQLASPRPGVQRI